MTLRRRETKDKLFTGLAGLSFAFVAVALVIILSPILWRGAKAVVFSGTVEFRELQFDRNNRGNPDEIEAELAQVEQARKPVYEILERFERGIRTDHLEAEARNIFRQYRRYLDDTVLPDDEQAVRRNKGREIRDALIEAFDSSDKEEVHECLSFVLSYADDERFKGTPADALFGSARDYKRIAESVDLSRREEYADALEQVRAAIAKLFGPRPGEPVPGLLMEQYGATRWDRAQVHLESLLRSVRWENVGPGQPLQRVEVPREKEFEGTELAALFPLVEQNLDEMLRPRPTFYWRYFTDDRTEGYVFGGVGPHVVGTISLTLLAILFAVPLGVVAAAYLVEYAGDNPVVMVIRTCINTLAGVPSIVFGLFGLAFFVIFLLPRVGMPDGSNILAGSLTLAVLILPIIIRASEEAIRAVPHTYKEASLSLGASRFRAMATVILPAALPGVMTAIILSMSRAAGETAPILFTAAVALGPIAKSLAQPTPALSYGAYDIAVGDRTAAWVPHKQFGMVMTLVVLVLLLNMVAILVRARMLKRLRGQ
jgi:phosphate transport system permease protein